jgi:hypothetical protein
MTTAPITEYDDAVITEHFRCECGHEWSREMHDGLVEIGCPKCGREHLTTLGRFFAPLVDRAKGANHRTPGVH